MWLHLWRCIIQLVFTCTLLGSYVKLIIVRRIFLYKCSSIWLVMCVANSATFGEFCELSCTPWRSVKPQAIYFPLYRVHAENCLCRNTDIMTSIDKKFTFFVYFFVILVCFQEKLISWRKLFVYVNTDCYAALCHVARSLTPVPAGNYYRANRWSWCNAVTQEKPVDVKHTMLGLFL